MPRRVVPLWAVLCLAALASAVRAEGDLPKDLDTSINQLLREWEVPGLALAVVKDDTVVLARGYGVRRLGDTQPVTDKTVFAIASCSKAFTAAALAMLVDEGKLGWDDPVAKHLRNFQLHDAYASREITVRDLLCHRSGLPRCDMLWYGSATSRDEVLKRLRFAKPTTSFRSQFGYQNIMFLAAGQVVPAVNGKSWDDFLRDRIFNPLGMTASSTSTKALPEGGDVATPHQRLDRKLTTIPWRNIDIAGPAGSINSNVTDMAQWIRLQLGQGVCDGKRLLTSKSMREMHSPQVVLHPEGMGPEGQFWELMGGKSKLLVYGFGWLLHESRGRVIVEHAGSIDGMRSLVVLVPEEKLGLVILTNRGSQMLPEVVSQLLLDSFLGGKPRDWNGEMLAWHRGFEKEGDDAEDRTEKERVTGTKPSLTPEKYAGSYNDDLYGEIKVANENDKLKVRYGPTLVGSLDHWHDDTFRVTWNDRMFRKGLVTFRLNAKREADEVKITQPGWSEAVSGRRRPRTASEPAIVLGVEKLRAFLGTYRRTAPPMDITIELLGEQLKWDTFGESVATLVPIKPNRFRVDGAATATYLEFEMADGKVKELVFEKGEAPKVRLLPVK